MNGLERYPDTAQEFTTSWQRPTAALSARLQFIGRAPGLGDGRGYSDFWGSCASLEAQA